MSHYITSQNGDIAQGDILCPITVKDYLPWWADDKQFPIIIMTPACDLENSKADYHRFCILQPFPLFIYKIGQRHSLSDEEMQGKREVSKGKSRNIRNDIKNAVNNKWPRYHYLPEEDGIFKTPKLIDFEVIGTIPLDAVRQDIRIAKLNSPYKEELIHRFSHHIMRIGTPDHPDEYVQRTVDSSVGQAGLQLSA